MTHCSDVQVEPLPGTAKKAEVYVLFEWPKGWSRDVLDGDTFGPELTAALKKKLGTASLQLIRRPGRQGHSDCGHYRCFVVWAKEGLVKAHVLRSPEEILDLDLEHPEGECLPLTLVCTHAKRDVCCALKGRPLAAELAEEFGENVWETSHTKGHRFAPSVLLMPWGYSFGRLNAEAGRQLMRASLRGEYFYPANRGCGLYSPAGQVAELAVARQLLDASEALYYGDLTVEPVEGAAAAGSRVTVRHADGRAWSVELDTREVSGTISSCGDEPKTSTALVAKAVSSA
ncbi:sucrase ferredoxin [Corynebacterium sp.]|uniref:sucrase ferredoxin n=1 Tax=Corynebacterium sp. TaxID=1720 RepID=UPI0026DADFA3|nr:sucrase ferredoxin [Corynebacterium sp.]MDO5031233.1 sucrase ferredoxin [Corynebacterium sp.]